MNNTVRVQPAYKCCLCDMKVVAGQPQEVPYEALPEILGKAVRLMQVSPHLSQWPAQIPHKCKDKSCGVAYFAGFLKI